MKLTRLVLIGALAAAGLSSVATAHHSNAMFERVKVVTLNGTVQEYQWTNPHIWIELDVPAGAATARYSIEGASPSILRTKGWKFNSLKAGDKATVVMHPLKNGQRGGAVVSVSANGTTLYYEPPPAGGAPR